jgi:Flp pilus assembly protein CpaB
MAGQSLTQRLTGTREGAIALGIVAATLAAIVLAVYLIGYRDSVAADTAPTPVLVAKQLIARGTPGSVIGVKQLYESTEVAANSLKVGAIADPATLNGRVTAVDVYPGQQLTDADFVVGGASSGVTAILSGNQRAVSISVDPLLGSLASLQTGDHVDIYQELAGPNGTLVKLFRQNIPVLQAPGGTATTATGDAAPASGVVILQVPSRDAADLIYASQHTKLSFSLRPAAGGAPTPPRVADQSTMLRFSGPR